MLIRRAVRPSCAAVACALAISSCHNESHGSGARSQRADAGQQQADAAFAESSDADASYIDAASAVSASAGNYDASATICVVDDDAGANSCANGRPILADQVVNARDLGGTPLADGKRVAYGTLFRGPPLAALSSQGCAEVSQLGIRTLIDLRVADERDLTPDASCVCDTTHVVLAPLPIPSDVSPAAYIADLNTTESIAQAFRALGDADSYPIYFHCTWGRDRTGILAAVILLALGASRADILQEYLLSLPNVGAYPLSLAAALDEIARRGGVDAYLAAAGVSVEQLATLRARATLER